jgi:hypothetical protein
MDLWYNNVNLLRDNGTYMYNTDEEWLNYFWGTASHNTMMLGNLNQMKKEMRFIWTYWTNQKFISISENELASIICVYKYLNRSIEHIRKIKVNCDEMKIEVYDEIKAPNNILNIYKPNVRWHIDDEFEKHARITIFNNKNEPMPIQNQIAYYSPYYGQKIESRMLYVEGNRLTTCIQLF